MMTLRTADEVRDAEDYFTDIKDEEPEAEMLELAEKLIEQKSGKFDPSEFKDRYHDAVIEMVKAKVKGQEPVIAKAPERGKVINLMDALRQSLDDSRSRRRRASRARAPRRDKAQAAEESQEAAPREPQVGLSRAGMSALGAETVTLVGRFAALPNRVLASEIERRGGTVRRGLSQQTTLFAIGRHSAPWLADGRLQARLARADQIGARCIGESALLRRLGLLPAAAPVNAALRLAELPERDRPRAGVVRLLELFEVIQPQDGALSFRDLVAAREVARLTAAGLGVAEIIASAVDLGGGPRCLRRPSARPPQAGVRRAGPARAPHRRSLRRARRPDAPAARRTPAIRRSTRCSRPPRRPSSRAIWRAPRRSTGAARGLDRSDPIAPFNLANVLREQGRLGEAKSYLQLAIAIDPALADGWYNLALLLEAEGQKGLARAYLERGDRRRSGLRRSALLARQAAFRGGRAGRRRAALAALPQARPGQRVEPARPQGPDALPARRRAGRLSPRSDRNRYDHRRKPPWRSVRTAWSTRSWRAGSSCPRAGRSSRSRASRSIRRDRVYVFNRGAHPVIVFDKDGRFLDAWGEGIFSSAHGIFIDRHDHVYCADNFDHTVRKFTTGGELLMTLGDPERPADTGFKVGQSPVRYAGGPFNMVTNVAVTASGEMFISDGYGNARVHRFSPDGRAARVLGRARQRARRSSTCRTASRSTAAAGSTSPTARTRASRSSRPTASSSSIWDWVNRPDDLFIDEQENLYIAELGWNVPHPDVPHFCWSKHAPVGHAPIARVTICDLDGNIQTQIGGYDPLLPGNFIVPHGIWADSRGDFYVGEVVKASGAIDHFAPLTCHAFQKFIRAG